MANRIRSKTVYCIPLGWYISPAMKIVFIHYHLKTGGVTTVLKQQVDVLKERCDTLVLTGELPAVPLPAETVHIPGLGYDPPSGGPEPEAPDGVAARITAAIHDRWPGGCDVVHVHNPTLAKNRRFLKILKRLQKTGFNLLLQIHDFAEDGRPGIYFKEGYPSDCHYGVLNSRDHRILLKAGLDPSGLHLIPNTVSPLPVPAAQTAPDPVVLYPVRAIRRKNIGEALLLSFFFRPDETLQITQPPNSPADMDSYADWKAFAKAMDLQVVFEAGVGADFPQMVQRAKFLLTTSITEGFGFSFLEPWTAGKLLWGRRLANACEDFTESGVRLDHLYERMAVPLSWIGGKVFFRRWTATIRKCCARYGHEIPQFAIQKAFETITAGGTIDFGLLDEQGQKAAVSRVRNGHREKKRLLDLNPFLGSPGSVAGAPSLIRHNRRQVLDMYTKDRYRENLMEVYGRVMNRPVRHHIDKSSLLAAFFDLESFSLLKWADYADER